MKKVITIYKSNGDFHNRPQSRDGQVRRCRFIIFREAKRIHVFNSYDQRRTPYKNKEGLQIGNTFYYVECGVVKHSKINKQYASIRKTFGGIPHWADPILVKKYYDYQSKKSK